MATQSKHLWDALGCAHQWLGFDTAAGGDEVFRQLVLARLVEPNRKLDLKPVLAEPGIVPRGYRTIFRRLPVYAPTSGTAAGGGVR